MKIFAESSNEDRASAVSARSSVIELLTALAEMFDLMSRISLEPHMTDYRRRCIVTLLRAIKDIQRVNHDDYFVAGVFLGVSHNGLS